MRLDNFLVEKGYFDSRTKAKQSIERGEIFINDKVIMRPAFIIDESINSKIERICEDSFVSLGGFKLKKALLDFNLDLSNMVAADIGASTGGFTDCLLKNGVRKVYSIDLNDQLLHSSLKVDSRVNPIIKNAKDLTPSDFNDDLDIIVADLSFISVTCVIEVFSKLLSDNKMLLILLKPQFETGGKRKFKNGIIRDKKIHHKAINSAVLCANSFGFSLNAFTTAPMHEDKNLEFLLLFVKNGNENIEYSKLIF